MEIDISEGPSYDVIYTKSHAERASPDWMTLDPASSAHTASPAPPGGGGGDEDGITGILIVIVLPCAVIIVILTIIISYICYMWFRKTVQNTIDRRHREQICESCYHTEIFHFERTCMYCCPRHTWRGDKDHDPNITYAVSMEDTHVELTELTRTDSQPVNLNGSCPASAFLREERFDSATISHQDISDPTVITSTDRGRSCDSCHSDNTSHANSDNCAHHVTNGRHTGVDSPTGEEYNEVFCDNSEDDAAQRQSLLRKKPPRPRVNGVDVVDQRHKSAETNSEGADHSETDNSEVHSSAGSRQSLTPSQVIAVEQMLVRNGIKRSSWHQNRKEFMESLRNSELPESDV